MGKLRVPYLVIGSNGMLGSDIVGLLRNCREQFIALDQPEIDIRDFDSVLSVFKLHNPEVVINTAALTDVDGCESRAKKAFEINAKGAEHVAKAVRMAGSFLVHISTDYVFDGKKEGPYIESDPVNPLSVYGKSKAEGEIRIREQLPDQHCIVRTQWLFGIHGRNFVETILSLAQKQSVLRVVNDQRGSPTFTSDLATALIKLCERRVKGTIHVTNSGEASWYDFAVAVIEKSGLSSVRVEPMLTSELNRPAQRPLNSILDNFRYVSLFGRLRHWEKALDAYLKERTRLKSNQKNGA